MVDRYPLTDPLLSKKVCGVAAAAAAASAFRLSYLLLAWTIEDLSPQVCLFSHIHMNNTGATTTLEQLAL